MNQRFLTEEHLLQLLKEIKIPCRPLIYWCLFFNTVFFSYCCQYRVYDTEKLILDCQGDYMSARVLVSLYIQVFATSEDPDQLAFKPADQGLHCLHSIC